MNSDIIVRSFFDSTDSKATFLFAKPASHRKRDLNTTPTVKGTFTCRGDKSKKTKQGVYALHNQLLVFYGVKSDEKDSKWPISIGTIFK